MPDQKKELAKITDGSKIIRSDDPNAIFSPEGLKQMLAVCQTFIASGAVPICYKTPQSVLMAIQAGRELGMKPVESMNGMMIVNGQIKLWGTALSGRVTQLGYKIKWGECTNEKSSVLIVSPEGDETDTETYTIEEAKKANLLSKSNWIGHAKTMLRWRALGNCVKFNFPHLLQGYSLVDDDDTVDSMQGEKSVPEKQDNASKLLNKDKPAEEKKEKVVEGEVVAKEEEKKIDKKEADALIDMLESAGSVLEKVEEYYKKDIYELSITEGADLRKKLVAKINEKIKGKAPEEDKKEDSKPGGSHLPPVKPDEGKAAKAIRKADAEKPVAKIPEDVCKYINFIEGVNDTDLPSDIVMLKLDANRGEFKGYDAYPNLADQLFLVKAVKEKAGKPEKPEKKEDKSIMISAEILEVSNELASHDPKELTNDEKDFILDVNSNNFKGKTAYPKVKF